MMGFVWGFYLRRIAFGNTMCGQMVSPNGTVIEEDRFGIVMRNIGHIIYLPPVLSFVRSREKV